MIDLTNCAKDEQGRARVEHAANANDTGVIVAGPDPNGDYCVLMDASHCYELWCGVDLAPMPAPPKVEPLEFAEAKFSIHPTNGNVVLQAQYGGLYLEIKPNQLRDWLTAALGDEPTRVARPPYRYASGIVGYAGMKFKIGEDGDIEWEPSGLVQLQAAEPTLGERVVRLLHANFQIWTDRYGKWRWGHLSSKAEPKAYPDLASAVAAAEAEGGA